MKPFALIFCLVLMSVPAQASEFCFVVGPDFPEAYEKARAVFLGEVVKIDKPLTSQPDPPLRDRLYRVTFRVEYSWKGAGFREAGLPELVVLSDQGQGGECFSWGIFLEGEKYLVYADETTDKNLIVNFGNRTALLWKASADLKELRKLDSPFALRSRPRFQ